MCRYAVHMCSGAEVQIFEVQQGCSDVQGRCRGAEMQILKCRGADMEKLRC